MCTEVDVVLEEDASPGDVSVADPPKPDSGAAFFEALRRLISGIRACIRWSGTGLEKTHSNPRSLQSEQGLFPSHYIYS